ncbi:HAMP domain-containing histidine kinase [Phormidium sp. CLA17]|uniref:sensor histidine kinase n=1 Tax=Leptolyngbya sp. Cla-17 TaxID=2803751 RepID=UPI001A4DC1F6|nr:HAMP domain-containing sensor histidine kinase [Leptolyngbya sp. Cla-17]MBM0744545.1 HAMP domain-containing histidine kinase [Leptolyngbya sp. Cla-17]
MSWQNTPLSEHQQYGICLYAQAINSQLFPQPVSQTVSQPVKLTSEMGQSQLQEILQRQRHQLRTPLALMLLYVDLLKKTVVDRRSQDWIQHLHTTIQEMHISLDHLTESPDSANQLAPCDLRQVLHQCLQGMHLWIEQKQLKLSCDAEPLWLRVDEWKIKQVFQNLLANAIAFSPIAGQITCTWQTFQTEVLIKINDNGPGLSGEDLRSLGTPFYSRRLGGTGLGLSIAKQIILEHQGSLWGSNLPDGGAQFCIVLPRSS